jgi:hypothetical protein
MAQKIITALRSASLSSSMRLFTIALGIGNVLFYYYVFSIFAYNVPQMDDLCFMAQYKIHGIFGSIGWWYTHWQGRYLPELFTAIFTYGYEQLGTLLPYGMLLVFIFVCAVVRILKHITGVNTDKQKHFYFLWINLGALLLSSILFLHFDTTTFFWLNVSTMYFGGITLLLLGISEIISEKQKWWSWLILIFSFLYAGCAAEHYGALILAGLGISLSAQWFFLSNNQKNLRDNLLFKKSLIAFLVCLLSFSIMYFAPGNAVRLSFFEAPSLSRAFRETPAAAYAFTLNKLGEKIKFILLLIFPFAYAGSQLQKLRIGLGMRPFFITLVTIASLAAVVVFTLFIMHYAVANDGPARAHVHLAFLMGTGAAIIGLLLGNQLSHPGKSIINVLAFCSLFVYFLLSYQRVTFFLPPTITYAKAVKQRFVLIDSLKSAGFKGTYSLPQLPFSTRNILIHDEMSESKTDSTRHWINKCVEDALQLDFEVVVEKKNPVE